MLYKDKQREYERIEREMNGLRQNFEYQVYTLYSTLYSIL